MTDVHNGIVLAVRRRASLRMVGWAQWMSGGVVRMSDVLSGSIGHAWVFLSSVAFVLRGSRWIYGTMLYEEGAVEVFVCGGRVVASMAIGVSVVHVHDLCVMEASDTEFIWRVEAIAEYEKTRANLDNGKGSGPVNTGGVIAPNVQGCTYKTFMNGKPHPFNGIKSIVGLRCWIKKVEKRCRGTFEGFLKRIKGNITSSKPTTLHNAINMACELVEQAVQGRAARVCESNKRKWEDKKRNTNNNNPNNNNNNNNRNRNRNVNAHYQRQEAARVYMATPTDKRNYAGNAPYCNKCRLHHYDQCPPKCGKCHRIRHPEKDCQVRIPGAGVNSLQDVTCYGCGEKGHLRNKCLKGRNQHNEGAHGRAYVMGNENPQQNPNVVTGTLLVNDHYVCILFDSGAKKSFVSTVFTPFINIAPATLDTSYEVELADGKLAYHRAIIDCYEKIIRIPLLNGEILEVQGEEPKKDPRLHSCIKADEKKLDDIRIICDFPEVFLDDLSGLPLVREIEFCIDLIPGALPVVRSLYRFAPSEMLELSNQLKELQKKGFIRPRHLPWGAPALFCLRERWFFCVVGMCIDYRN
ncbi:putative reverse transcriptase domain-containing protein [Tanacetum coccineum]